GRDQFIVLALLLAAPRALADREGSADRRAGRVRVVPEGNPPSAARVGRARLRHPSLDGDEIGWSLRGARGARRARGRHHGVLSAAALMPAGREPSRVPPWLYAEPMLSIVPFEERHVDAVLALIGSVFAEYGLTFDPAGYDADLTRIETKYRDAGGEFWVLEHDTRVVGTVAVVPLPSAEV